MTAVETALSLCGPIASVKLREQSTRRKMIADGQRYLQAEVLSEAKRVYIGTESCEYFLVRNALLLESAAEDLRQDRISVTLVLPPTGQACWEGICHVVRRFAAQRLADELVCNDIGMLLWASSQNFPFRLRAGRHFDKAMREARIPAAELPDIANNSELFTSPYLEQTPEGELLKQFGICGAETDHIPGFQIRFPENQFYAFWYPRAILSYCTTCEFAGSGNALHEKFIPGNCMMQCMDYYISVHGASHQKIIKSGRLVETITHRSLRETCCGQARIVLQCGIAFGKAKDSEDNCPNPGSGAV